MWVSGGHHNPDIMGFYLSLISGDLSLSSGLSPIHDHHNITGHELSLDNFSTVGREDQSIARAIKEVILIKSQWPIPE